MMKIIKYLRRLFFGIMVYLTILLSASTASAQEGSSYSTHIVGTWVNTTSRPTRMPTFKADGTFTCAYVGSTQIKSGTWFIKGRNLFRTFENGNKQMSKIVEMNSQHMVIETPYNSQIQVDRYTRYTAH